ncbi:MAG: penicillin-binding protein activator LpoB [Treponema sp.]|nr:penicillin-binding protein activator LpoB [Treponema sp.]
MKKIIYYVLLYVFGVCTTGNIFSQNTGRNESVLVVNALFANMSDTLEVYIEGIKKAALKHNVPTNIVVSNGNYPVIFVVLNGNLGHREASRRSFPINVDSDCLIIDVRINNLRQINTTVKSQTKLANTESSVSTTSNNSSSVESAMSRIATTLIDRLPKTSIIAVLNISSSDQDMAAFAIDELEFQLVTSNLFKIVDRTTLDSIRSERHFQMSGEVSDDTAVSIGNMLGANIVITGSITESGNTRRITIKALDVKTSQIVAMSREGF